MAKEKPVEISVATVFDGKKEGQQAFIELILYKRRAAVHDSNIDAGQPDKYNDRMSWLFSGITDWLKQMLSDAIMANFQNAFNYVNSKVQDVATQVGQTPAGWGV